MALTREDIATMAFALVGGEQVTDFSTQSNREAIIANLLYEELVEDEMASYPWSMCKQQATLSRITDTDAGTDIPDHEWLAKYRIDPATIAVRGLFVEDQPIEFEIFGDQAFCNASSGDTVVSEHLIRKHETYWWPYFRMMMINMLASYFGGALARDGDLVTAYENKYIYQLRRAKSMDAQADTSKPLRTTRLIRIRR